MKWLVLLALAGCEDTRIEVSVNPHRAHVEVETKYGGDPSVIVTSTPERWLTVQVPVLVPYQRGCALAEKP